MEYEIKPWHNTSICSKLHRSKFEDFITQARTDRYDIMCYLVAHDRMEHDYKSMKAVSVTEQYQMMQQ